MELVLREIRILDQLSKHWKTPCLWNHSHSTWRFKGQLQRFHKLSLFDRFRHVENGFDINSWKFIFVFLLQAVKVLKLAARTTFPKKDGKICALVPQKARAWAVTSLEININSYCWRKILYISCMQDSSEAWWEWLHITTDTKQNHVLIMKKVLINCKLRECMLSSWPETISLLPQYRLI